MLTTSATTNLSQGAGPTRLLLSNPVSIGHAIPHVHLVAFDNVIAGLTGNLDRVVLEGLLNAFTTKPSNKVLGVLNAVVPATVSCKNCIKFVSKIAQSQPGALEDFTDSAERVSS